MKTLISIILASSVFMISCDDSSSSPDYTSICDDMCNKEAECDLLGDATLEECVIECNDFATNMLDPFVEAVGTCTVEKTCEELAAGDEIRDVCYDENVEICDTNIDAYVEAACLKILECNGNEDPTSQELEECAGQMHGDGNIFICFKQSVIDSVTECVTNATECNPDPVNVCVEDILGIDMGNSGAQQ